MPKKNPEVENSELAKSHFVRCRFCGQKNSVKDDYKNDDANCGKCKLPLSNEPHKKFTDLHKNDYVHPLDKKALKALKAIPGVDSILKKLLAMDASAELQTLIIEQIYDSALLVEGLHPDPSSMASRVQQIIEAALDNGKS